MATGLMFRLATVRQHRFLTGNPREEVRSLGYVFEMTNSGCIVAEDLPESLDDSVPHPIQLLVDKTSLNILRDSYNTAVRRHQRDGVSLWEWHMADSHVFLSPAQAEQMSLYWDEIWNQTCSMAEETYPIEGRRIRSVLKEMKSLVEYASVFGKWVHIGQANGH